MQIQKYSTIKILGRVGFRSKIVYIQNIFIYISNKLMFKKIINYLRKRV